MHKCDFCLQEHEPTKICNVKQALNFLFNAGHIEQFDHFASGNWKFRMRKYPPAQHLLKDAYFCKVSLKKFVRPIADEIVTLYTEYGNAHYWHTPADLEHPAFPLHKYHERIDATWK